MLTKYVPIFLIEKGNEKEKTVHKHNTKQRPFNFCIGLPGEPTHNLGPTQLIQLDNPNNASKSKEYQLHMFYFQAVVRLAGNMILWVRQHEFKLNTWKKKEQNTVFF